MKKSMSINDRTFNNLDHLKGYKAAGFDAIDYTCGWGHLLKDDREEKIAKAKENLAEADIECFSIHMPCYNIFLQPDELNDAKEEEIKRSLEMAGKLGVKWCVMHPMGTIDEEHTAKWIIEKNAENAKRYLEIAEKAGTAIALENVPHFGDCPQYVFVTSIVENHLEIIEKVGSPNFQVCWDFGHQQLNISDADKLATVKTAAKYIKAFHFQSNYGNMDWHFAPCFGNVDWKDIVKAVYDAGYDGSFILEVDIDRVPIDCLFEHYKLYSRRIDEIVKDAGVC